MKTWYWLRLSSHMTISFLMNKFFISMCENKNLMEMKIIQGTNVTNFQLTLAWAEENFPALSELLGPVEPEISIFFLFASVLFQQISMVLNNHSQQQNVATNLHSVVYEILINRYTLQAGTVLSPRVVEYSFDRGIETKTTRKYYPIQLK